MSTDQHDAAGLPAGPRPGDRHVGFFDDPITDHLLRAVVTLASELSVTRDRLATVETLLAQAGVSGEALRVQFGLEPDAPLRRELKPPKLHSDVVYCDDDMRINHGSMGGVYVLRRLATPGQSVSFA